MKTTITSTHIVVVEGSARYAAALDDTARDCSGREVGTFQDAINDGVPIWCVDDRARGASSFGLHGALYVGDAGHPADYRVVVAPA